jgi:hypothetical protein
MGRRLGGPLSLTCHRSRRIRVGYYPTTLTSCAMGRVAVPVAQLVLNRAPPESPPGSCEEVDPFGDYSASSVTLPSSSVVLSAFCCSRAFAVAACLLALSAAFALRAATRSFFSLHH